MDESDFKKILAIQAGINVLLVKQILTLADPGQLGELKTDLDESLEEMRKLKALLEHL
ncbi:MAG: hypothetical protein ACRYF5_18655 [Janthinobacterium lividum]